MIEVQKKKVEPGLDATVETIKLKKERKKKY